MANIFDLQCEEAQLPLEAVIHESQSERILGNTPLQVMGQKPI